MNNLQKEEVKAKNAYSILKFTLIILAVVALGIIIVNQTLAYYYKAQLLAGPCELCAKLNPNQSKCIGNCFSYRIEGGVNSPAINKEIKINLSGLILP